MHICLTEAAVLSDFTKQYISFYPRTLRPGRPISYRVERTGQPFFNMAFARCMDVRMVSVHARRT